MARSTSGEIVVSPGVGAVALDAVANVPIWFRWKLEPNEKGALTKVPYCAHHEGQASHTKPRDWGTLTQARASLERWGGNGLGIVAAAIDDQYVHACLDVDGCYPPDSSKRDEWVEPAAAILAGCYHERSFSRTGEHYHFLVRREGAAKRRWRINAKRPSAGGLKDHGFELAVSLDGGYYLTCTRKGEGELRVIEEPELQALYDYINSFKLRAKKQHKAPTSVSSSREPDLHANTLAAIAALANDGRFVERDDWIVIGMAVHDGTGGSAAGLRAWIAWTERLHADAENACSRAWATFTEGGGTTVATLFMFAREDGWLDPRQPRTRTDYARCPPGKRRRTARRPLPMTRVHQCRRGPISDRSWPDRSPPKRCPGIPGSSLLSQVARMDWSDCRGRRGTGRLRRHGPAGQCRGRDGLRGVRRGNIFVARAGGGVAGADRWRINR